MPTDRIQPVLLHTNIVIRARYWMKTTDFKTLLSGASKANKTVVISKIVLDELIRHFTKQLENDDTRSEHYCQS